MGRNNAMSEFDTHPLILEEFGSLEGFLSHCEAEVKNFAELRIDYADVLYGLAGEYFEENGGKMSRRIPFEPREMKALISKIRNRNSNILYS